MIEKLMLGLDCRLVNKTYQNRSTLQQVSKAKGKLFVRHKNSFDDRDAKSKLPFLA